LEVIMRKVLVVCSLALFMVSWGCNGCAGKVVPAEPVATEEAKEDPKPEEAKEDPKPEEATETKTEEKSEEAK
jgi:hypothetical protein